MPVAICSPANSGALPRYASSPADDQRRPSCNRISLSAIMNSRDDTDHLDLNGLLLHDDIDETTFSELIPSVTEPDTGSLISGAFAVRNSFDNLPDAGHPDMNGWMGSGNDNVKHTTQNVHDVCGSGIQACTALLEPASEGLEWDDSGDLRGLQPRPGSMESRFGRFSLPLIEGFGGHPGGLVTRTGSGATIFSGMEQIPVDKPYRSAFTLAAEAAEALVTGRGRHLTQQHLQQQQQQQQLSGGSDKNKLHSGRLSEKSLTGVIANRLSAHSVRTSEKEPSPPVCCSTPAQRPSNVRVDRQRHPNPKFDNAGPASSESPTIPVQSIHSSRGHVLSSTAKVHPVQFGQHSQPIPGESTETIHSLFSNAPMRHGLTAQTDTSRSRGDLNGRTNDSIRFNDEAAERKFEECSENPLAQLGLIRSRDAVPLLGLLDRLERGSAVHLSQSDLPNQPKGALETSTQELDQERVQLDIDRSFLQFYTKELKGWRELAETLRHSIIAGNSFGAHNTFTDSDPYQTQLAVDAFCDWLSVLENRVEVCLSHLNRRATWIDQLTGFSHELKSSFAVVEERVKNSLRRARDLLLTWRERCYSERAEKPCEVVLSTQSNGRSDEPVAQIDQRQMLETLDDLQNLSDGVLTFQVRLGSCHLVNDCWGSNGLFQPVPHSLREPQLSKDCVSISNDAEQISDGASFSSSFSSFLDAEVDAEPNCTESTHLRLVTERAERLQRRLRATIRRLERTVIASTGTSSVQNVPPANHSPSVAVTSNKMAHPISSTSVIPSHPLSLCLSLPSRKHAFLPKYLLFPFLTFIVLFLALLCSYYLMMGSTSRLLLMDHPFCPRLPGRVVVDFSPNWWVRMLACLQLPSAQDITW